MCTRLVFMMLLAAFGSAQAGPVEDWHSRDDAELVIVLIDGLVDEFVHGRDINGRLLMPRTREWAGGAVRYADVLAQSTNALESRALLRDAIDAFDADEVRWLRDPDDLPDDSPDGGPERRVVVLDLGWLRPPLQFDEELLVQSDPAPWSVQGVSLEIEGELLARMRDALRIADLRPGAKATAGDVRWVVGAAHASIDERLAAVLRACDADGTAVLLTATSAIGLGERGVVGPAIGTALDVARVPVYLSVPGLEPAVDSGSRQWIGLDSGWFTAVAPEGRYTWSAPAQGASGQALVCELRWTTAEFTLLDTTMPRRPPRLFDLELDPGEWLDRAVEYPSLADSLKRRLRADLYGETPVVVFRAGDQPVGFSLSSMVRLEGPSGRDLGALWLEPGETVRVRMPEGAGTVGFGKQLLVRSGSESYLLAELTVHSSAWRAALLPPDDDSTFTIWIE